MHRTPGFAATVKELFSRRTTRGAASRRRGTSRNGDQRVETLEPRLALAVAAFFEPTSATLLASPGSDLYLTKVVGDELWVGESSTFVGRQTIPAISTLGTLAITTGVEKTDTDVEFAGFPMSSANTTTFVLSKTFLLDNRDGGQVGSSEGGELYGTLTCVQPDGTTSTWTFTNWDLNTADPAYNLSLIRFTSGPKYGGPRTRFAPGGEPTIFVQPRTGYYVPLSIELINNTSVNIGQAAASLQIRWNQPLTNQQQATIKEVRYDRGVFGPFGDVTSTPQTDRDLLPSAPQRNAVFNLPAAAEVGSLGIVPGTLTGTIAVDGVPLDFTTRRASDQLYFTGGPSPTRGVLTTADGSRLYVTGRYESAGRISLTFESGITVGGAPQDPGRVLVSANYGVRTTGPKAGDVTFFAGHDLTNPIAVDVLTPGSTVHVDSPLLSSGEIAINATNVRFEGTTTTPGVLRVNAPNVSTAANIQTAQARAEISAAGQVLRLIPVAGFEGSGYDADKPPTVTIGAPQSVRAEAALGRVNGSVVSINLNEQGSGYVTAPAITITPPDQPGGVQAVVTCPHGWNQFLSPG